MKSNQDGPSIDRFFLIDEVTVPIFELADRGRAQDAARAGSDIEAPSVLIAQRVAMKIGDHYGFAQVSPADWRALARSCAMDEERIIGMLTDMARALPDVIFAAHAQARTEGLSERVLGPLAQHLIAHARERLQSITAVGSGGPVRRRARRPA